MSKDINLQKQFTERQVQRMRNIITKNTGDKTHVQVGYENTIIHNEGDIWEEDGKTWTIKNGIKKSIPKMARIKAMHHMPLACPQCGVHMDQESDYWKHVYRLTQKCPKCATSEQVKKANQDQNYYENLYESNKNAKLDDLEKEFEAFLQERKTKFLTESGESEGWVGGKMTEEQIQEVKDWIEQQRKKD